MSKKQKLFFTKFVFSQQPVISLSVSKPISSPQQDPNEQTRSRPITPKPSNNASRSNTPKANKPLKYETPNGGNSPSCRSIELTKSGKPRTGRNQLDTSLTRISLQDKSEKSEVKGRIAQLNITNFNEDVDSSPKFNTTYSSIQTSQKGDDEIEPTNIVKIKKKPARMPAPGSSISNCIIFISDYSLLNISKKI